MLGWNFPKWCKENNISEFGTRLGQTLKNSMNESMDTSLDSSFLLNETLNLTKTSEDSPERVFKSPLKHLEITSTLLSNFKEIRAKTPKQVIINQTEETLFDFK